MVDFLVTVAIAWQVASGACMLPPLLMMLGIRFSVFAAYVGVFHWLRGCSRGDDRDLFGRFVGAG